MALKRALFGGLLAATALADAGARGVGLDARAELAQERQRGARLEQLIEDAARRIEALEQQVAEARQARGRQIIRSAVGAVAPPSARPTGSPYAVHMGRRLTAEAPTLDSLSTDIAALQTSVDHVWILAAGLICFFLQAGFGMLEAGAVREKNAKNIMLKNLMDACIGGLVYYLFGWALAYGVPESGANDFVGWGNLALAPASEQDYLGWFFQYVFAATIATIVSGAVAERIKFQAYMIYSAVLTGVIYPIASHWIWCSDGFLFKLGVIDYAGGGAVHALSGVAALMGAMALGPRHGRFVDGKPVAIPPHDTSMMGLGVFILWFGFIPFNAGSGLSVVGGAATRTARIAVITTLGGCSGAITSLIVGLIRAKHCSLEYCMNGVLAGMVAVCSCCAVVRVWAVFFFVSPLAALSFWFLQWVEEKLQIDDPLGASSLHFGPGIVGLLAVGFLADPEYEQEAYGCAGYEYRENDTCDDFKGIFYGGTGKQLGIQLLAGVCWTAWGLVACGILFYGMKFAGVLRVSLEDEIAGLDATHHGGPAYNSPSKKYGGGAVAPGDGDSNKASIEV